MTTSAYTSIINDQLFSSLLTIDPEKLVYVPYLAESLPEKIKIDTGKYEDLSAYKYRIRDEAKWDNGTEITGHDYATTMKMVQLRGVETPIYRSYLGFIEDVLVNEQDPRSFTVVIKGDYFKAHEITGLFILPAYHYDSIGTLRNYSLTDIKDKDFYESTLSQDPDIKQLENRVNSRRMTIEADGISGSGPYEIVSFDADKSITLKKKDDWWGDALAKSDQIFNAVPKTLQYEITNDQNTAFNKLLESYVNILGEVSPDIYEKTREEDPERLQFFTPPSAKYYYFGFNTLEARLNSKEVRKALAHLVDYDLIIELLCHGNADRIIGPILPSKDYYNNSITPTKFDPEVAKNILQNEGWQDSNGNGVLDKNIEGELQELSIPVMVSSGSILLKDAIQIWSKNAKEIGVEIKMEPMEFGTLRQNLKKKEFSCFALAASLDLGLDDLYQQWHSASILTGSNRSGFGDEVSDALIEKIRSTSSMEERNKAYLEIQEIIHESQPFIFLFSPQERILMSNNIKDPLVSTKHPGYFENYYRIVSDHGGS